MAKPKKPAPKSKPLPARATPKAAGGDPAALVAAIREATDVAGLKTIVGKLAKLATPEAHAAIWDLSLDPPKLPFKNGLPFIAMQQLDRIRRKRPDVRELFVTRCQQAVDSDEWSHAVILLASIAFEDKPAALKDRRLCAAIRRTIGWKTERVSSNAIFVLTKVKDDESLPAIFAQLAGTGDEEQVVGIAEAMVALKGTTAADLDKLRAKRATLKPTPNPYRPPFHDLDRLIKKLEKRFPS